MVDLAAGDHKKMSVYGTPPRLQDLLDKWGSWPDVLQHIQRDHLPAAYQAASSLSVMWHDLMACS